MAKYEVHDFGDGTTIIPARAIARAVNRRLSALSGVVRVRTTVVDGEALVAVTSAKRQDGTDLRDRIDDALGLDFWIDLGMADMTYSITIKPGGHRPT